jgi:membrane protein DedA with SNARE-associated domain
VLVERKAKSLAQHEAPSWAATAYQWVEDHLPKSRRGRIALAVTVGGLVVSMSVALLIMPIWVDLSEERFQALGYTGVFFANLASTATVFVPVPGLTAAGQALIITQGDLLNPVLVGILGGTGMAIGEVTAYAAGSVSAELAREERVELPRAVRPVAHRVIAWVDWLMDHYGFITLLVLSAIPNPTFELAGITAGASGMRFWRFMVAVLIGKNIRGLLLAFLGAYGVDVPFVT